MLFFIDWLIDYDAVFHYLWNAESNRMRVSQVVIWPTIKKQWSTTMTALCLRQQSHPGQLSLLPSVGGNMSNGQGVATLCDWGVKAGMIHSTCGLNVRTAKMWSLVSTCPSALEMSVIYKVPYKFTGLLFRPHQYYVRRGGLLLHTE